MYLFANECVFELERYAFRDENELQKLLFDHPQITLDVPELEASGSEVVIKYREFMTSRGSVDLVYITRNADIYVIETKLIRNPESIRTVIAQIVDYVKAITSDGFSNLLKPQRNLNTFFSDGFAPDDRFCSLLNKNVQTGNIVGIIIGDDIHPNLLGLVESIQSAPHLAFSIELIRIEAYLLQKDIIINAMHVEKTKEVERSVIRITFDAGNTAVGLTTGIDSESPSKEGQGSKPKLKWSEYIDTVDEQIKPLINDIKQKWVSTFEYESISMGIVGFSAGFFIGNKRIPILFVYNEYMELITVKDQKKYGGPDESYTIYRSILEKAPEAYDKLVSGKKYVKFNELSIESIEYILTASLAYALSWKNQLKKDESG